ncbi:DNA repair protein RecN [Anaeromicrobium sediminis]|nr:DNA repair protein RecN [Anaeromicrobium sediminis]
MLLQLMIKDYVLIDKLEIRFCQGLNILSGETGAGKSILIGAIGMALGERADKSIVRKNAEKATIQLIFSISNNELKEKLLSNDIELIDEDIVMISRSVYANGRSTCRINDKMVTVSYLKELSKYLIDVFSQHAHQSLLYPENHIHMLDAYGEKEISPLMDEVKHKYEEYKNIQTQLSKLYGDDRERERKKDLLEFQVNEIMSADLKVEEEESLIEELHILSQFEKISNTMSYSYESLYSGNSREKSIVDELNNIVSQIDSIKDIDSRIGSIYDTLQESLYNLEDITREIRDYNDSMEYNPNRLEEIQDRLELIDNLKRKYGDTIGDILIYKDKIEEELEYINNSEILREELKESLVFVEKDLSDISLKLSLIRKELAKKLERELEDELKVLNMENAAFKVEFAEVSSMANVFSANGIDRVEFLISTNPGESLKGLSKIASGGEISRIMLGFKTIFANVDKVPTLVFDEIDTGISGRTADIVSERLGIISKNHQILCITHLPQIAKMADYHFYIEKTYDKDTTTTNIRRLTYEEQLNEIGRLIGGNSITDLTLKHAEELLNLAKSYKKSII